MDDHIKSLIRVYADGQITADQLADLEQSLRENAAVRTQFLSNLNLHATLEDLAIGESERRDPIAESNVVPQTPSTPFLSWPLATATLILIALSAGLYLLTRSPEVVTITGVNGSVQWTGNGGQISQDLITGQGLTGGTIELLSTDTWVELEFRDGSAITLSGQTAVTISNQGQKELHLRYGCLSAHVEPEPNGQPMLVHTQAAELEMQGTQFNVNAQAETTTLTVNQGHVRLRQVTNGQEINVPARHEVFASFENRNGLIVRPLGNSVSTWHSDLKSDVVHGKWSSNLWELSQRLKVATAVGEMPHAEAVAAYKDAASLVEDTGSVWAKPSPLGALVCLAVSRHASTPVVLSPNATLRIQGRLFSEVDLDFGITTHAVGGGFAGKYRARVAATSLLGERQGDARQSDARQSDARQSDARQGDARQSAARQGDEQAFDILLPLSEFQPTDPKFDATPIGKELVDWWCITQSERSNQGSVAKLQITNVELSNQPTSL
jgi:hypothetical protein